MKSPPARRKSRWSFMMVEREGGRTVRLKWMKPFLALWFLATVALASTAGGLFFLWDMENHKNADLREALELMTIRLKQTKNNGPLEAPAPEKTPPSASRPVPAGFLLSSSAAVPPGGENGADAPDPSGSRETAGDGEMPDTAGSAPPEDEVSALPPAPPETADSPPPAAPPISIDAFSCVCQDGRFRIRFDIHNILPGGRKASGHIIAVLEDEAGDPDAFISAPDRVPLSRGRPDGRSRGETFSISRFKRMSLTSAPCRNPKDYSRVRLYVFERPGDQLVMTTAIDLKNGEAGPAG